MGACGVTEFPDRQAEVRKLPCTPVDVTARLADRQALFEELGGARLRIVPFLPTHLTVKEIAERLHLSAATVKSHLSQIHAKLGASTGSETVEKMDLLGLGLNETEMPRDA